MLLISSKINKPSVCVQTNLLLIKNALFSSIFLLKDSALNGFWVFLYLWTLSLSLLCIKDSDLNGVWVFLYLWTLMVWVLYVYKTSISTESECSCDFSRIMHVNDWLSPLNSKIKDDFPNVLQLSCFVEHPVYDSQLYTTFNFVLCKLMIRSTDDKTG